MARRRLRLQWRGSGLSKFFAKPRCHLTGKRGSRTSWPAMALAYVMSFVGSLNAARIPHVPRVQFQTVVPRNKNTSTREAFLFRGGGGNLPCRARSRCRSSGAKHFFTKPRFRPASVPDAASIARHIIKQKRHRKGGVFVWWWNTEPNPRPHIEINSNTRPMGHEIESLAILH